MTSWGGEVAFFDEEVDEVGDEEDDEEEDEEDEEENEDEDEDEDVAGFPKKALSVLSFFWTVLCSL